MRSAAWTDSVTVLDRITAVFDAFGEHDEGLGVSEVARRSHLPKSTVSRIAAELVAQRLLDREGDKLYLGVRLFELGQTVEQPRRLRGLALPVMTRLRDLTGQTVTLAMREGMDVVIIAIVRAEPSPRPPARVGGRLPAHATALGKALLAFAPPEQLGDLVESPLPRRTAQTICDPTSLRQELDDIRHRGVAVEQEECFLGRVCVASPVLGHGALPLAAISVTGAVDDLIPDRAAPSVRAAGMALSRRVSETH